MSIDKEKRLHSCVNATFVYHSDQKMGFTETKLYKNIKEALKPGVTPWLITVTRFAIILCFCAMFSLFYLDGSIHYLVAAILSLCLFLSFEYSVIYMKKCPEFLNISSKKETDEKKDE